MATTARQAKPAKKGPPEPARRTPAWSTNARSSPTFSPPNSSSPRPTGPVPLPAQAFPPLGQASTPRPEDRVLHSLSGLTGTTVTVLTKSSQRYEGIISAAGNEGDVPGVTLKEVKEISAPGNPSKEQIFIPSSNIESWTSGPADAASFTNGDSFRTDGDISNKKPGPRERELQAWQSSSDTSGPAPSTNTSGHIDDETFGAGSSANHTSWDQFAANEQLFGVKATFDENVYTTKLDRSGADFKEREKKAIRIANEITGAATNNPHLAEERNQKVDDSGVNEEDKYGAVVRGSNAYVPPGARKAAAASGTVTPKTDVPKVAVNGPDGASQSPSSSSKATSPAPANKPPADAVPAFRDFVSSEKQRLTQKRQALVKNEMDKRMADLVKFSQSFKLNKPIPDDLVPILAKDEEKQKAIKDKATKDATSASARTIGPSTTSAINPRAPAAKLVEARKVGATAAGARTTNNAAVSPPVAGTAVREPAATTKPASSESVVKKKGAPSMYIQPIPPFKGNKTRQSLQIGSTPNGTASMEKPPLTPKSPGNRLNVNASSFKPNPQANTFTPGTPSPGIGGPSSSVSPKPREGPATPNPFFGTRPIKKTSSNIKDDFNPFKHNKVVEASAISATWPYTGKRYSHMFPQHPQNQHQHSPHMGPPVPPPMPPPSYEEDSAAQAASRGYVYYPPYAYGQPMMPGMPPPQGFIPGPYMQPMPYPPGMPPNVAMYGPPPMGQMPPPQAYMSGPPPGTYPPPPNGAQGPPRPSMPPTPIPAHAHPYYHQSPQLQHAVPYPMMMPPPPPTSGAPPHGYEGGPPPPQQMTGHA